MWVGFFLWYSFLTKSHAQILPTLQMLKIEIPFLHKGRVFAWLYSCISHFWVRVCHRARAPQYTNDPQLQNKSPVKREPWVYQAHYTKYFSVCSKVRQPLLLLLLSFPALLPTPDSGFDLAPGDAMLSSRCCVGTLYWPEKGWREGEREKEHLQTNICEIAFIHLYMYKKKSPHWSL